MGDAELVLLSTHAGRTEWGFDEDIRRRASMGFAVHMAPGAGQGVFATQSFEPGDTLLEDPPLFNWPCGVRMSRQNVAASINELMREMTPSARAQMSSLVHASAKHMLGCSASESVFQANCLPSHVDGGSSLYADACKINHSCAPSLEQSYDGKTRAQRLNVTRPNLECGDELTISYINEPGTRDERRARLHLRFGFDCACSLCSLQGTALEQSDARQARMRELRALLMAPAPCAGDGTSTPLDPASILAAVDEMLALQQSEGLPSVWGQEYLIRGMRTSEKLRGHASMAARYASKAAEATRIGVGATASIYGQLLALTKKLEARGAEAEAATRPEVVIGSDTALEAQVPKHASMGESVEGGVETSLPTAGVADGTGTIADTMARYKASLERANALLARYEAASSDAEKEKQEQQRGAHYNATLRASNVWEVGLPADVVDEASALFETSHITDAFQRLREGGGRYAQLVANESRFFALRSGREDGGMGGTGASDITYISADDATTYEQFERLFRRLNLEETLGAVVQPSLQQLRMYSAMFIVRSECAQPFFHSDWADELGVNALTLMTPLADYRERASFNLLYGQHDEQAPDDNASSFAPPAGSEEARYQYRKNTAICFGAAFRHSTEPGRAHADDGVHAYLCFTFGTDDPAHWPLIASAIGGQSRVCRKLDGSLTLTRLGLELEASKP